LRVGEGFFRPDSRPARDLGVLLARCLAEEFPLEVLDGMAGCGIRALRYGLEAGARQVVANDADPRRLAVLEANLRSLPPGVARRATALPLQQLLAGAHAAGQRFSLVDLDAFGSPFALVPAALEAVAFGGVLYLASSDGRSPTGHDRRAAIRRLGAAARAHPASWEIALRLQLGVLARCAWTSGRGIEPLLSFSEGRTFRTAVRLRRQPAAGEEAWLGMTAHCHRCGDQQVQSLLALGRWAACCCGEPGPLAVSGPLWIGPLQDPALLDRMGRHAETSGTASPASRRLLERLTVDRGVPARVWPAAEIARRLGGGPPRLGTLVDRLRQEGHRAGVGAIGTGMLRSDAPWPEILASARHLVGTAGC
jgi:tRNA (guanine26-N2/guanine27-N2)-dimethyltransferase